jgi:hypothetical protein
VTEEMNIEDAPRDVLRAWADAGVITLAQYVEIIAERRRAAIDGLIETAAERAKKLRQEARELGEEADPVGKVGRRRTGVGRFF